MGETDFHISVLLHLRQALALHFRRTPNVYVAANMFLYYEEGNPSAVVAPDVFVVRGVDKHKRRTFKLWEEKVAPRVVIEITSLSSRLEDLGTKRAVYEMLGVHEYFLFDPLKEYLTPQLQGFRLKAGQYRKLVAAKDGSLRSEELRLILQPRADELRLIDPRSKEMLLELDEAVDRIATAQQQVKVEARRAETEARRAETEARRAKAAAAEAHAETARADRAERELARLRAQLAARKKRS
jgi:Uma2 family endonuclease